MEDLLFNSEEMPRLRPGPSRLATLAAAHGIPLQEVRDVNGPETAAALRAARPDLILSCHFDQIFAAETLALAPMGGINLHPSLLPLFPGLHTHQRAIDAGMTTAGCTIHFVTEGMDEGPVILQAEVPVLEGDTADTLAARVLVEEHKSYPAALRLIADGKVRMHGGKTVHANN